MRGPARQTEINLDKFRKRIFLDIFRVGNIYLGKIRESKKFLGKFRQWKIFLDKFRSDKFR